MVKIKDNIKWAIDDADISLRPQNDITKKLDRIMVLIRKLVEPIETAGTATVTINGTADTKSGYAIHCEVEADNTVLENHVKEHLKEALRISDEQN